jgi:hypothetical protein
MDRFYSINPIIEVFQETEKGDIIRLQADMVYSWNGKVVIVPAGFESDGASVPRFLWSSVSPQIDPRTLAAAIAHDYIYRNHPEGWTREMADDMFYDICRSDGLSWWSSQKAYWGIRLFGGSAWREEG